MYGKKMKHYEKGEHHGLLSKHEMGESIHTEMTEHKGYEYPKMPLSEHLSPKMEHGVLGEYHKAKKKHMPKLQQYKIYPDIEVE